MKKWIIVIVLILALAAVGAWRVMVNMNIPEVLGVNEAQKKEGVPVKVYKTSLLALDRVIYISGTVNPYLKVEVAPRVAGRITSIPFKAGQLVRKGDVLLKLDDRMASINLQAAQVSLANDNNKLAKTLNGPRDEEIQMAKAFLQEVQAKHVLFELELDRQKKLYSEKVSTLQQLQIAQANNKSGLAGVATAKAALLMLEKGERDEDINIARIAVKQAEVAVAKAQRDYDYQTIKASFDGVVTLRKYEVGDMIDANISAFQLLDNSKVYLDMEVSELYLPGIKKGMKIDLSFAPYQGASFSGIVDEINPFADLQSRSYLARVLIDNADGRLYPGMYGKARIIIGRVKDIIAVPEDAIGGYGFNSYVMIADNGKAKRITVKRGEAYDNMIHIISGLDEGMDIINMTIDIKDGDPVKISNEK